MGRKRKDPETTVPSKKEPTQFNKLVGRKQRKEKNVAVVMTEAASELADKQRKKTTPDKIKDCIYKPYAD